MEIRIKAEHFGYSRFHEYEITNGVVRIREIHVSDNKELSYCEAKFTGEIKELFDKATGELFRQFAPVTKSNRNIRDGTRYTVLLKNR